MPERKIEVTRTEPRTIREKIARIFGRYQSKKLVRYEGDRLWMVSND